MKWERLAGRRGAGWKARGLPRLAAILLAARDLRPKETALQLHAQSAPDEPEELEAELLASHDRYQDLYEHAPVGYLTLSPDSVIATVNATGAELLGAEPRFIVQRRFDSFILPEYQPRYEAMLSQVARHGGRQSCSLAVRQADGSELYVQLDCASLSAGSAFPLRLTLADLSERKRAEAEIANLAFHDPLTHLPNRRLLLDRLMHAALSCYRNGGHGALLLLDLDRFKLLNDTQGHEAGDRLLRQVGRRLTTCVREMDTVARLGGDEFVVLLEDLSEDVAIAADQAKLVGRKILTALSVPYTLAAQEYRSTGSMGVTLFCSSREPVEDILKRADLALYRSKGMGRGMLQFFDPDLEAEVKARAALEAEVRHGLQTGQFVLHYQPQVDSADRVVGVEALVRWQHPSRGLLYPAEFISLAQERGLILSLGEFVISAACMQLAAWALSEETAHLTIAINLSTSEFAHPGLVERSLELMRLAGANPERLIIEVTESLMLGNLEETTAKMLSLKAHGVRFALDDFGMGFSSLAYLKRLPLDQLKIDSAFVRDMLTDASDAAIVGTILTLGRSLSLTVIAEGVETDEQREFLARHGCRYFQGKFFGSAVSAEDLDTEKSLELRSIEAEAS